MRRATRPTQAENKRRLFWVLHDLSMNASKYSSYKLSMKLRPELLRYVVIENALKIVNDGSDRIPSRRGHRRARLGGAPL